MKRNNDTAARKAAILDAAVVVAARTHYAYITYREVSEEAGVSGPLVRHYFGNIAALRWEVMNRAIEGLRYSVDGRMNAALAVILAQGVVAGDMFAQRAPPLLKRAALAFILEMQ